MWAPLYSYGSPVWGVQCGVETPSFVAEISFQMLQCHTWVLSQFFPHSSLPTSLLVASWKKMSVTFTYSVAILHPLIFFFDR